MNLRRRVTLVALAVLLVAAIAYGFRPRPIMVDTAAVARGRLAVTVEEEGRTRVIDRYVVSAPVDGYAQRITLDVGDAVAKGQPLLTLEPLPSRVLDPRSRAEAEARVAAAQAALEAAREQVTAAAAGADFARAELERTQRLRASNQASAADLDRASAEARRTQAALGSARFAAEVARHELEAARTALRYSGAKETRAGDEQVAIRSPVAGRVLGIERQSEGVVAGGQPLIEIGNPRALEIVVEVLSKDAVRIEPGMPVEFERWGGAPLAGRVRRVEPTGFTKVSALGVEEQRVLVIADIVSPPETWEQLGDGYRVEAVFTLWAADNVLQVPASALFRYGEGWAVFVIADGRAERRAVEIGQRNGLQAQVTGGLKEGEVVIVHPGDQVEEGARVEEREE